MSGDEAKFVGSAEHKIGGVSSLHLKKCEITNIKLGFLEVNVS